jgi:hypothetical protein
MEGVLFACRGARDTTVLRARRFFVRGDSSCAAIFHSPGGERYGLISRICLSTPTWQWHNSGGRRATRPKKVSQYSGMTEQSDAKLSLVCIEGNLRIAALTGMSL